MSILDDLQIIIEADKWVQKAKPKKGKMHKLLGLKDDETVTGKYTSGKKLAKALLKATNNNRKKVASMLAFAANADKTDNVLDAALKYMGKTSDDK